MKTAIRTLATTVRRFLGAGLLAGLVAGLVAGCSDSTSPPTEQPRTGAVAVVILDRPAGANCVITLDGEDSFTRQVTGDGVVTDVPAGDCTVTTAPVVVAPEDTVWALAPVQVVTVVPDDTVTVTVTFEPQDPDPEPSLTVFHGPLVFQGSRTFDAWVPLEEYGRPPTITNVIDEYSLPYPAGFILDGCTIVGTDRTTGGISIDSSASGQFGSGAATASLTMGAGGTITLNGTASGSASASSAYVGNGSETGYLTLGYPDSHRLYDLVLAVSHPSDQPLDLVFTWSYSGSVVNTDYAYWHAAFSYQVDPLVCGQNTAPFELFHGRDFTGPESDSGSFTVTLGGGDHLIGLSLWIEASGSWVMDYIGRGDDGSAAVSAEVSIELAY